MTYVRVLGVAQDGGHPQPGCRRACCIGEHVVPHLTTCVAVVDGDQAWLLDAGPDMRAHLAGLDAAGEELAGILITHGHIGHYTGLMYLGKEAMNTSLLPVWASPRLADFLQHNGPWEQLISNANIDLRVIESTIELTERILVAAFPVPHRDEYSETVGFRVGGPNRSVLYVPDTDSWGNWDTAVEDHIRNTDIALLDATFYDATELPHRDIAAIAHPLVIDSLQRFADLGEHDKAKIRFTHLNHSNPLLDPDSEASIRVARSGMAVAREGDVYAL